MSSEAASPESQLGAAVLKKRAGVEEEVHTNETMEDITEEENQLVRVKRKIEACEHGYASTERKTRRIIRSSKKRTQKTTCALEADETYGTWERLPKQEPSCGNHDTTRTKSNDGDARLVKIMKTVDTGPKRYLGRPNSGKNYETASWSSRSYRDQVECARFGVDRTLWSDWWHRHIETLQKTTKASDSRTAATDGSGQSSCPLIRLFETAPEEAVSSDWCA